jgi:hypothetical protein
MNERQQDAKSQYLAAGLTAYLVFKRKDTGFLLPAESEEEGKRFKEAMKEHPRSSEFNADVSLLLTDLAQELVVHGYQPGEPTVESFEGSMTALRIMPADADCLRDWLSHTLKEWIVPDAG